MRLRAVCTYADNNDSFCFYGFEIVSERARFLGTTGGVVLGVKIEDDLLIFDFSRDNFPPSPVGRVKSGAFSPTLSSAIFVLLPDACNCADDEKHHS